MHHHHIAHDIHTIHPVNMTVGNPLKKILRLAVPLMLTSIGQQMYSVLDAIIVGRGVGMHAFAALGSCDWLVWAVLWSVLGLTQGFSTLVSRYFGAGKEKDMRRAVSMSVRLCLIFGAAITVVFILLARPLLLTLNTPEDIIAEASVYLITIYSGTLILIAYNMSAAILRSIGDGRTPLIAVAVAGTVNVLLNFCFVMGLNWGIEGAACATLIAQFSAFAFCLVELRRSELFKLEGDDWKWDKSMAGEMCRLGVPLAFSSSVAIIGGILSQAVINTFGAIFVAGCTAATKFHGLMDCTAIAIGFASSTFISQNYGAKQMDMVRKGIKIALKIALVAAIAVMIFMFFFEKYMVGIFLDKSILHADMALDVAYKYVSTMNIMLIGAFLMNLYRYSLQGLGNTVLPMISGFMELGTKLFVAYVFPIFLGAYGLFYMDGLAWWVSCIFQIICFYVVLKKREMAIE